MAINPNWPTLFAEGEFGVNPCYAQASALVYTDLTPRLYQSWSVRRGMQFELGQMQPGEYRGQWLNRDGALDPTNTTSPFSPGVLPFRGYRLRAQYPPSVNLLDGDIAGGGDATPLVAGAGMSTLVGAYGTPTSTGSATAWQGTRVWQVPVFGGVTTGLTLIGVTYVSAQAVTGLPYTMTFHLRSTTTGANPVLTPFITWVNISAATVATVTGSTVTLTGSPTASWTTTSLSATVPSGAVAAKIGFTLTTAPGSNWTFQADGIQFEQAASASTFSASAPNTPIYTGLTERYPQSWTNQGTYGVVTPIAVDAFALLSQDALKEAFIMDTAATNPTWFYPLNDPSTSTMFAEQAGRYPTVGLYSASGGAGSVTPGSAITAPSAFGKFVGTNGPVTTVNNTSTQPNHGTVIDLSTAGITGAPSTGAWTRMIAFRSTQTTGTPTFASYTAGLDPTFTFPSSLYWQLYGDPNPLTVNASLWDASGNHINVTHPGVVNDGVWHLTFLQMDTAGTHITVWVDGTSVTGTSGVNMHPTRAVNDSIGGDEYKLSSTVGAGFTNFIGDIALYAQWNSALTNAQMQSLYLSWRFAWQTDSTDDRYARILAWAGYTGPSSIGVGSTQSVGPANDISGVDALTALNAVVDTEAGRHYVATDGTITFQSRKTQFINTTPMWTFGENPGEIPYANIAFDYDPTHVANTVTVSQSSTNQSFYANDTTSQAAYGPRTLNRVSQATDAEEVRQSAYYWLTRYAQPALRVSALHIDVGVNPVLFPSILKFEIGQRVRINRRDPAGLRPTITTDGFIEQITHTGDNAAAWTVDLQISPAPIVSYAVFTTLQTTTHSSAFAGAVNISVNALPDAATNPIAGNLTGGQQMVIGTGANAETVTIASGGVPTTSPGYTSATLTLAAPLANNHLTNDSVQADPSPQYFPASAFNSAAFCF